MANTIEFAPRGIDDLKVLAILYDGTQMDLTENVENISLFESIFAPFMHGELNLLDNSSMASVFPWWGQEKVIFQWKRQGDVYQREFRSTGFEKMVQGTTDGYGRYKVGLTSADQLESAIHPFSRSYCDPSHKIIEDIFTEFVNPRLMVEAVGKETHNIVFPYMKPLQAIDIVLKNCLDMDDTPMFLYDRFYDPSPLILTSYKKMVDQNPICDLIPLNAVHDMEVIERGEVYEHVATKGFPTIDHVSNGNYKAMHRIYDLSKKTREEEEFFWKDDAPHLGKGHDWIPEKSHFYAEYATEISKWFMTPQNEKAFDNGFPNLYGTEELDRIIHRSYMDRISTNIVQVHMDSIAYTVQTGEPFTVGRTVNYYMPTFAPITEEIRNLRENLVVSGKYVISAIRHHITDGRYTMSVELVRDFMGEEAGIR